MKHIDSSDDQPGDALQPTLGGLEQLAGELDGRQYPGQAWPAARAHRPRRWAWKLAASIAAVAALVAVTIHYWPRLPSPGEQAPAGPNTVVRGPTTRPPMPPSEESELPRIVIVEDMDSYSIIDLTNDRPLVSFASKNSPGLDDMMPVLLDGPTQASP